MFSLDFGSIFSGGWQRFISNIGSVLLYSIIYIIGVIVLTIPFFIIVGPAFLSILLGLKRGAMLGGSIFLFIIIAIIVGIVGLGWGAGFASVLKKLVLGEKADFTDMFSQFGKLLQLVIFSILAYIAIAIGLIILIIPGLFLMIAWSQAFYLIIDKNLDAISAMKTSWDRVLKDFWTVTGVFILLIVIIAILSFILGLIPILGQLVLNLFVVPFMFMVLWALYFALFPREEAQPTATEATPSTTT